MKNLTLLLAVFLAACSSCTHQPSPVPTPPVPTVVIDAGPAPTGDASPGPTPDTDPSVRAACAAIAAAGCAEGIASCAVVMQRALARLTNVPLACLVAAVGKPAIRKCGSFVACL